MNTQKVAITIPKNLIVYIDKISKEKGLTRSGYITSALKEKIMAEKNQFLKNAYDRVFSDESLQKEQLDTAKWFEGTGNPGGQEW
ncbi:MAG: ribbon-helix-helix domain-containing protein [Desulfobacteraceae bacterium]|nr:ribbon-helix-helix domain-containing protein [Desulfobacteraceae bacterium]